ncbi:PIN domain-containing protein [Actinobacteria bacterium YIM 96077]|uniref:Ribonuclease VapC n=1 Tax=Phytoactinopolyspora halophila TaxID=1981511 RepID=A0A329QBG7_9ACTN|nr:type II toxin-antitoxin system VapC family toxin [Phytoactinopolyspora halophila]AYY13042.1 PIN domain-containing protein [Actinobacteria bacterium YIM 96077]RAW09696.1 VapC toxin family PIN domain ribonuclease [Phytoactinopolyspora halophila]
MIVDASAIIDAVADAGPRGEAARRALAEHPASEPLIAPGHFAFEVMSGLRAAASRPQHPFQPEDIEQALLDAEQLEVSMDAVTWVDVHRAWALSSALRYADAIYVACAERHRMALLTSDGRIARSGQQIRCEIVTITPES